MKTYLSRIINTIQQDEAVKNTSIRKELIRRDDAELNVTKRPSKRKNKKPISIGKSLSGDICSSTLWKTERTTDDESIPMRTSRSRRKRKTRKASWTSFNRKRSVDSNGMDRPIRYSLFFMYVG